MYKKGTILIRDMSHTHDPTTSENASEREPDQSKVGKESEDTSKMNARVRAQAKDEAHRELSKRQKQREAKRRRKAAILTVHEDLIRNEFWTRHSFLLDD